MLNFAKKLKKEFWEILQEYISYITTSHEMMMQLLQKKSLAQKKRKKEQK